MGGRKRRKSCQYRTDGKEQKGIDLQTTTRKKSGVLWGSALRDEGEVTDKIRGTIGHTPFEGGAQKILRNSRKRKGKSLMTTLRRRRVGPPES